MSSTALTPHLPERLVVCEFVGLPGAGKSTVAAAVIKQLQASGLRCEGRRRSRTGAWSRVVSAAGKTRFHLRHPQASLAALRFCSSVRPPSALAVHRALRLAHHGFVPAKARQNRADLVVLDQGLVQEMWSVVLRGQRWSEDAARRLVRCTVSAAMVMPIFVYLDISIERSAARLRERGGNSSRFDRMGPSHSLFALARSRPMLDRLFELATVEASALSCRLDADRPPADLAADIVLLLHRQGGIASPPPVVVPEVR